MATKVIKDIKITFESIPTPIDLTSVEAAVTYTAELRDFERLNGWQGTLAVRLPAATARGVLKAVVDAVKQAEAAMDGGGHTVVVPVVPAEVVP